MSTFNDTRHVIDGDTGGGTDDTTAYNDVLASGSTLTFTSINGDQKSVSVTGGAGGSVQAFNNATLNTTTNEVTFSSTTGASSDEVLPVILGNWMGRNARLRIAHPKIPKCVRVLLLEHHVVLGHLALSSK